MIVELGLYVMERTARQLSRWQQDIPLTPALFGSVNISSRQLLRHDLFAGYSRGSHPHTAGAGAR